MEDNRTACGGGGGRGAAAFVGGQGEFTFDIPGDSTGAHQVKIVCTDAAGNEQTEEITNFYVTTNLFVRYYNNKPLFFGSIAAVVVIAGVGDRSGRRQEKRRTTKRSKT